MKKDLRIIKTKASLHEAILVLLQEKSLDKISISELCKVAQVNRGTFYLHYQDVSELFEEYFEEITEDLQIAYYEPYHLTGFEIEKLQPHMVRIFHHVRKFDQFYAIVFNRKTPLMYYYRLYEVIRNYLMGSINQPDEVNQIQIEYNSSYQANAIIGMVIEWIRRDMQETPEELNKLLLKFTLSYE